MSQLILSILWLVIKTHEVNKKFWRDKSILIDWSAGFFLWYDCRTAVNSNSKLRWNGDKCQLVLSDNYSSQRWIVYGEAETSDLCFDYISCFIFSRSMGGREEHGKRNRQCCLWVSCNLDIGLINKELGLFSSAGAASSTWEGAKSAGKAVGDTTSEFTQQKRATGL